MAELLSPSSIGVEAWIAVGLYVLGLIGWEWRKTVRHARRERRQTQQFADAVADPANWELVTSLPVEAPPARFDDLVGKTVGIRVDEGEMQSTTLVHVAYVPDHSPARAVSLTVSPAVVARRMDGPHRFSLEYVRRRSA